MCAAIVFLDAIFELVILHSPPSCCRKCAARRSKLSKFLMLVQLLQQDSFRSHLVREVEKYRDAVLKFIPDELEIESLTQVASSKDEELIHGAESARIAS